MSRTAPRVVSWLICALVAGCAGAPPAAVVDPEDGVNAKRTRPTGVLAFTDLEIVSPAGAAVDGVGIRIAGASYPVVRGKARVPTDLLAQARAAGGLKIEGPGGVIVTAAFGPDGAIAPITLPGTDPVGPGGAGGEGAAGRRAGAPGVDAPPARPTNGTPEEALVRAKIPGHVGLRPATSPGGAAIVPDNGPVGLVAALVEDGARPALRDAARGVTTPLAQLVTAPTTTLVAGGSGQLALAEAPVLPADTAQRVFDAEGELVSGPEPVLVPADSATFIANNGSSVIPDLRIIGDNGGGLISDSGGMLTGAAYFPFEPLAAKYQLVQLGVPALDATRTTPTGLIEYLWPGESRVRAVMADGRPLTDWAPCRGSGFELGLPEVCPAVFFLQAEITTPDPVDGGTRRAYALAFAPGAKKTSQVPIDASTTMVATSTLHLVNYIPPEYQRVGGLGETWEGKAYAIEAQIEGVQEVNTFEPGTALGAPRFYGLMQAPPPPPKPSKAQLLAALASANGYVGAMEGRSGDLSGAWGGFNPFWYGADLYAADEAATTASAVAIAKATALRPAYDRMYDLALAGRFWPWSFWAIDPETPSPPS